jgi:hypothetical protein
MMIMLVMLSNLCSFCHPGGSAVIHTVLSTDKPFHAPRTECVRLLIKAKADLKLLNGKSQSPLKLLLAYFSFSHTSSSQTAQECEDLAMEMLDAGAQVSHLKLQTVNTYGLCIQMVVITHNHPLFIGVQRCGPSVRHGMGPPDLSQQDQDHQVSFAHLFWYAG